MTIDAICEACIDAVKKQNYKDSTIFNYQGIIRRFKEFCAERNVTEYSCEVGKAYADDVISKKTGKFSNERYLTQGRFVRLIDSYFLTGSFDFSIKKRNRVHPENPNHQEIYQKYQLFLQETYDNRNTYLFYEYGMYSFLQFLNKNEIDDISHVTPALVIQYVKETKMTRQRKMLCEIRNIFRFLNRDDLLNTVAGIHAPRIKRIIPVLSEDEIERIEKVIEKHDVTARDAAIVIIGLSCGIRACDLIHLKLTDINWDSDTISFMQSKTGNLVCLPLTKNVGNAIIKYITHERPKVDDNHLFLRTLAPFTPLASHASCYKVVERVFEKANIKKDSRIFGMHMLRHNAASTMVKNEVPIETIAAILGHASPDTTDIYITTDVEKLKMCVLPMNGISKEVNA